MLISVATVTYNAAEVIGPTLQSVSTQTHPDVEHLIIDGASTDCTVELCQRHDTRIISEPDNGLYDAMNKALRIAKGEYIVFLNAGDRLATRDTLAQVAACAPADIIYGDTLIIDKFGNTIGHRRLRPPHTLSWRSFAHGMLVCHQSFYVRTALARQTPYDTRYRFSADFDWCIRLMKQAHAIKPIALSPQEADDAHWCRPLSLYLQEGMTTRHHRASLFERLRIMARHYGWCTALAMHLWFVLRAVAKR